MKELEGNIKQRVAANSDKINFTYIELVQTIFIPYTISIYKFIPHLSFFSFGQWFSSTACDVYSRIDYLA
jgi:hypothetical protein